MAASDCIDVILKAAHREMSEDEVEEIVGAMQRVLDDRRAGARLESLEERLGTEADRLVDEAKQAAMIEERNRLINIRVRAEILQLARTADAETGDPSLALQARTVGVNSRFAGARLSADARGNALFGDYAGGLIADLRREGLLSLFNARHLDRVVARELAELSKKNGRPGISGSNEARRIAGVVDKYRRAAMARENRAGAWIRPLDGYITRQTHDMVRLQKAGYEAWRDFVRPLLDERTFEGVDNIDKFLAGVYDGLVTGEHLKTPGGVAADLRLAFKGPANLAKRVSHHRKLHFRDADAWYDYNEQFGRASLIEGVLQDLEHSARNTALMEAWGPNPRAMFETILNELKAEHRGDVKKYRRLNRESLRHQFDEVDGISRIPVHPTAARVAAGVMAFQSMAKLGFATLSSMADIAFKAHAISEATGGNLLAVWRRNLTSSLEGLAPGEARVVAELIGVGLDGQIGSVAARFTAQDDMLGMAAKLQRLFFKFNLLTPWTDGNKRGIGLMAARDLARQKDLRWSALGAAKREELSLYGFDERTWDIARQAARIEADGREYLMPDHIRQLSDSNLGATGRRADELRDRVETILRTYYADLTDAAIPTPGARERAIMRQGTRPGTALGTAIRFVMQFKAFPITVLTKNVGRAGRADTTAQFFRNMVNGKADMRGLAHMIVTTTVLGYLAQSAKEVARGRSPRDPEDYNTWVAAMLQGGGLGLYGDFLFGEFNRYGRSALETVAGPTLGEAADLVDLFAQWREGDDVAAPALRFAVQNLPFVNLFYSRAALDYLVLYEIQEAVNPGYLRRMERRVRKENKQTFILPPSRAVR